MSTRKKNRPVMNFPYVDQFSFMLKPLFESFKVMVTTTTSDDFSHSVSNWVKEKLALPNLRIGKLFVIEWLMVSHDKNVVYRNIWTTGNFIYKFENKLINL